MKQYLIAVKTSGGGITVNIYFKNKRWLSSVFA